MSNFKTDYIRSKQYTDAAKNQSCVMCGNDEEGKVVSAHYSGFLANKLGKGAGIKAHDLFVADLCSECHSRMDLYEDGRDEGAAFEFAMAIFETMLRRREQGKLIIKGAK